MTRDRKELSLVATTLYPKSLGIGELTEPWRLEETLRPTALSGLEATATVLRCTRRSTRTTEEAYALYADSLTEAIDINLGRILVAPLPVAEGADDAR